MSRVAFSEDRCKGCLLCVSVCPKQIIVQSQRFNQQGYKPVEVADKDMAECTGCTSCALICPDCVITVYKTAKPKKEKKADAQQPA